jgi:hypothetical protein
MHLGGSLNALASDGEKSAKLDQILFRRFKLVHE